jgi:glycosyltransferase involved in cell wall biosynthesis
LRLLRKYLSITDYDVLMVGYPGQLDIFLARVLSWLKRKPLVWDVFMSIYLISIERELHCKNRLPVQILYHLEKIACALPDCLILDTQDYVEWFHQTYSISPDRFRLVPTGADNHVFCAQQTPVELDDVFRVVYYGTYIPNHGVLKIVRAAAHLKEHKEIIFEMIGAGPEREEAQRLSRAEGLQNVHFIDWLSKAELVRRAQSAAVCLGAFGDTPQSLMTVQNKIYEGLAMGKVVLTGEGPAVKRAFQHKEDIYLCQRQPEAIASAILELRADPGLRCMLEANGKAAYEASYTIEQLGLRLQDHLRRLVARKPEGR